MRISRRTYAIVATVLALLLILSAFMVSLNPISSTNVDATTGYGDLLQYEWPQLQGDSSSTRFSAGPAPEAPDILWKATIEGIQSFVTAFNGKVFVTTETDVVALDKDTGSIIWRTPVPALQRWPVAYKIDGTHLVLGKNCLDIETGEVLWVSEEFSASAAHHTTGVYSPEEKIFYSKGTSLVQAWNFSDISKPPTLAWEAHIFGGASVGSGIQYGDGKVFPGSFTAHQMALDAKTGETLWDTETKAAMAFSGSYYQGKFLRGGELDNTFYCFDADSGKIMWMFNPGTPFGYWASGCAAAYGKVYEANKDGHLYAIDVDTGQLVWKYKGPGFIFYPGYPVVADGKVYATTGQAVSRDPITGEYSKSEFACLDAFTGDLLWRLPIEAHTPRESVAVAYGNLYLIPGYIEENEMDSYLVPDEVWAVGTKPWPMWRRDPEHTATGQSGPTNLALRWRFTTGGAVVSSPSVVDRRVYVGSQDKNLYCLDARSGSLIWKFKTGFRIMSSPAAVDGKVYMGPDDGYVYCLNTNNGSLIWKTYAGGYIPAHFAAVAQLRSSPTVVGDRVYVGSLDTNMYCLDANNGSTIWTSETTGYITSSPAVVDGAVYITSQEPNFGTLYKLDAYNGSLKWKLEIPYKLKAERGTDMHASPTVADGMVFTSTNRLEYYGINATTGNIEWTYRNIADEFIVGSVTYHDGKLFLTDQFFLVCVDAKSGHPIWNSWLGGEVYVSPTYADGKVYIATDRRAIYVLNATTGDRLSWFGTDSNSLSSPTIYEGRVYVGNHDWNVYCLDDFPVISTQIAIELDKDKVKQGESVTGCGQLTPGIAYALIKLTFVKPDGTMDDIQVTALQNGAFNFTYTPEVVGNWTVTAWCSGAAYIMHSADIPLEVVGRPTEFTYVIVAVIVIGVIAVGGYFMKKGKKSSTLPFLTFKD